MNTTGNACDVCYRHCQPPEGELGFCRARRMKDGEMVCDNYGILTALALDPIEKKPLRRFHPGSAILSVGSYGCNMRCLFCQNSEISMAGSRDALSGNYFRLSPQELTDIAIREKKDGSIGVAFTYNEALIGWEYVLDTSRLLKKAGLCSVLVTNGMADTKILEKLLPYIDAMNIDLKAFSEEYYRDICGGSLKMVQDFIEMASGGCHVELTTLVLPGKNDSEEQMRREASWIASLPGGSEIPLHISRFFPRYKMTDLSPTPVHTIYHLASVAKEYLKYVYTGNC